MITGFTTHKYLDLSTDVEDPSQLIIRPGWDAPHVRCFPRVFYDWPCLLRQVGMALGSPCDCFVTGITYANPGSRHLNRNSDGKTLCMKIDQKNITNRDTLSVYPPPASNTTNIARSQYFIPGYD